MFAFAHHFNVDFNYTLDRNGLLLGWLYATINFLNNMSMVFKSFLRFHFCFIAVGMTTSVFLFFLVLSLSGFFFTFHVTTLHIFSAFILLLGFFSPCSHFTVDTSRDKQPNENDGQSDSSKKDCSLFSLCVFA